VNTWSDGTTVSSGYAACSKGMVERAAIRRLAGSCRCVLVPIYSIPNRHRVAGTPRAALRQIFRDQPGPASRAACRASTRRCRRLSHAGTPCARSRRSCRPARRRRRRWRARAARWRRCWRGHQGEATTVSGPLQQHHRAAAFGGIAHPLELGAAGMLVADVAEQARKLALMRGSGRRGRPRSP
jgi:hypothetical protein